MKQHNRLTRWLLIATIALCTSLFNDTIQQASACPMCKAATEEDDRKPMAYMYSILFMLVVPGTMVGGMAAGLVALGRREAVSVSENGLVDDESTYEDSRI
ncbi:MAG: hypothetical protein ACYTGL_03205 [Planctomycetota bacterium]|jgi:hypothetical protein